MANLVTLSRLILIPFFLYFMFSSPPQNLVAGVIFGLAAITDTLDGYIARKFDKVTELGKMIDPLVDRVFIITAIIALYIRDRQPPLPMLIILFGREIFVLLGFVYLSKRGEKPSVNLLGKTATAILMFAFAFMIIRFNLGPILFYIGLFLYVASAFYYFLEGKASSS